MNLILGIMKVLINGVLLFLGFLFLNMQLALLMLPFILVLILLVWFMDGIFNMYSFVALWFTLNGIYLGWSLAKKDIVYFISIVIFTIIVGGTLLELFNRNFLDDSNLLLLVTLSLLFGYGLFKFGFLTFLQEIRNVYDFIKYDDVPIKWLVIYYYCKYKKLKVFNDEYREHKAQPTVITVGNSGELSANSLFKNEESELLSLSAINTTITARLKIYPTMEVVVDCESYISISAVYKLIVSLIKNDVKEVGLRMK